MPVDAISDTVMDAGTYETVAAAGAGYMAPFVLDNLVSGLIGFDVPDEAEGLLVMGLAAGYGGQYQQPLMAGAGAFTFEAAAERVGIKQTVVNLGV